MIIKRLDSGYNDIANAYLLYDESSALAAIVDPGAFGGEVIEAAREYDVKYILLTHGHFDHILGVYELKQATGALIAIHSTDAPCLTDSSKSLNDVFTDYPQQYVEADILLEEGSELFLGETAIRVMATPGHTKGSVCFVVEDEKTLFSGDTLFCMTVGRTDFEGGSVEEMADSIKRLIALPGDYRVLPGHNRETTLNSERVRNRFIRHMQRGANL